MQVFLPHERYQDSVGCLDYRRLGKQRVECRQIILSVCRGDSGGWSNHPCTKMWRGHIPDLMIYHDLCILEWLKRGYNNTMTVFCPLNARNGLKLDPEYDHVHVLSYFESGPPPFVGDDDFHSRHRAALLYKDPEFYGQYGWKEQPKLDYRWS
jgi:hypothetical protein